MLHTNLHSIAQIWLRVTNTATSVKCCQVGSAAAVEEDEVEWEAAEVPHEIGGPDAKAAGMVHKRGAEAFIQRS